MKFFYLFLFFSISLFSCNCHFEGKGYVYDQENKKPKANVRIDVHSTKPWVDTIAPQIFTDSNGYFEYSHDFCYDMMQANYPNYIGYVFGQVNGDTIYLEYQEGN